MVKIKSGTVCFISSRHQVLLALIEYPNGQRLWNGIGGMVDLGETPTEAAVREMAEEIGITVSESGLNLAKIVTINYLQLHAFTLSGWQGEPRIIDSTLKELRWFNFDQVPYDQMHLGNSIWLPPILTILKS